MMTITFADPFQRTEAGRAEFKAHAMTSMSRPARNLLLVIDGSCGARDWVRRVAGSTENDLVYLLDAGLIAPVSATPALAAAARAASAARGADANVNVNTPPSPGPAGMRGPTLEDVLERWSFDALYTLLTHEARERFGLIKGYRLVLEIERCSGLEEMRAMAVRFIDQIRASHGEETAQRLARQIITTAPTLSGKR
jgi:hypothetical protein